MLKVDKTPEPDIFQQLIRDPRIGDWSDLYKPENRDVLEKLSLLRGYMLDKEQTYNRTPLCPYCERKVTLKKTHIEHIKPRGNPEFRELAFVYHNLLVSCNDPQTCGIHKKNTWKDTFINPVEDDPEPLFHYGANGKIQEDSEQVKDTVSILNLNHDALVGIRRTLLQQMVRYPKEFIESLELYFDEFPSFCRYYQKNYSFLNQPDGS